jgi:hypothetical protein
MKKLFKSIVVVVVVFSNALHKQKKAASAAPLNENSLMGNFRKGLSKTSYLYGTIHMICADDYFYLRKLKSF